MVMYGCQMSIRILGLMQPMVIGRKQNMAVPGYPITLGDGQLSITEGGIMTIIMDGSGSRATNGHLHG